MKLQIVRDFDAGTLSAEDAARYIVSPKRTVTEINRIKNFFKDDQRLWRKFANMPSMISLVLLVMMSFTHANKALELSKLVNKQYKEGALDALLTKETADGIRDFAADLAYLGDVGKEGAIVAATYATHPISKAGDRIRMKATSKIFANPRVMRAFARKGTGAANAQQTAGKVAGALDAGLAGMAATQRPIRQFGVNALEELA